METSKTAYQPDDYVCYGSSGVCRIISCENRAFDGEHEETYYKLSPVDGTHSTYYIPVDRASERLRPLMSKDEIYSLIDQMPQTEETEWCGDSRERRGMFQHILHSDNCREIIQMMRMLYCQQERKRSSGRKLSSADEAAMHAAEHRLYQEFGIVLGIAPEQVHEFICSRLEAQQA